MCRMVLCLRASCRKSGSSETTPIIGKSSIRGRHDNGYSAHLLRFDLTLKTG